MQTIITSTRISNAALLDTRASLDIANDELKAGRIAPALDDLFDDLRARREEDAGDWASYARSCLSHSLRELLHQDPFTRRAFDKPRGYAGDAVMMDYIYGLGEAGQAAREATPLGRAIFRYMDTRPSAKAVRYRRRLLAGLIDRVARRGSAGVLAIAAGHLREAQLSSALQSGSLREFVALDEDEASLSVVARDYARLGVRPVAGSVRGILSGKLDPGQYDLVYAAGLFDYLSAPVAAAFTRCMFAMVRPGGLMLIPNFLTGIRDVGYMESFMDWHLTYRTDADMWALASSLPKDAVADSQVFDDDVDTITYLLVSKAG